MSRTGQRVFDGDRLRATLFNGDARKVLVTFRQRITPDGAFSDPKPIARFVNQGYAHLHLQSRKNDWYINDETEAFEDRLRDLTAPYRRVVGTGFSMGGYAALRFSKALRLQHALLVSPQISIAPSLVPWDKRYRDSAAGFDPDLGDVARRSRRGLKGVILIDPFRPMDRGHADLICVAFPNITVCSLGCGGHPATRILGETGGFGRVQAQLLSGRVDVDTIRQFHRSGRRTSAIYWRHLAENAQMRGHLDLANEARARHAALSGD